MIDSLGLTIQPDLYCTIAIRVQAKARHLLVAEYLKRHSHLIGPFLELRIHYVDVLSAAMAEGRREGRAG